MHIALQRCTPGSRPSAREATDHPARCASHALQGPSCPPGAMMLASGAVPSRRSLGPRTAQRFPRAGRKTTPPTPHARGRCSAHPATRSPPPPPQPRDAGLGPTRRPPPSRGRRHRPAHASPDEGAEKLRPACPAVVSGDSSSALVRRPRPLAPPHSRPARAAHHPGGRLPGPPRALCRGSHHPPPGPHEGHGTDHRCRRHPSHRPPGARPRRPPPRHPGRPSPTLTPLARSVPRARRTSPGFTLCPAPGPSVLLASSWPVAHHESAMPRPRRAKKTRVSRRARHAVARQPGCTGGSGVRRACDTRVWRGPLRPSGLPAGPGCIPRSNATRARHPRPPCARWRARGSACVFGVGRSARRLTRRSLSLRATAEGHPCSTIWHRRPKKASKDLDSPPQSMCSARYRESPHTLPGMTRSGCWDRSARR